MDLFERFNTKFGRWYEGLFGDEKQELRPKDVLRKIIAAMEDNRKEGFDGKIYVPNKYVLELAVADAEERDYLLSFLDEEELVSVLQRFMGQNQYHVRGPLDFTIAEAPEAEVGERREKLVVKVRFEKGAQAASAAAPPAPADLRSASPSTADLRPAASSLADDLPTVPAVNFDGEELATVPAVAWAALAITAPDGRKSHLSLTSPVMTIGRSRNAGNQLVLESDGMVSKSHARIERERDGQFTLYDLGSMNGVSVNGQPVNGNQTLRDGDEIIIGGTKLVFQQARNEESGAQPAFASGQRRSESLIRRARVVSVAGEEYVLASETLIGRAVTCDIVLDAPSVSTKHARIIAPDATTYYLEDLDSEQGTQINGRRIHPRQRSLLADGDYLVFGDIALQFVGGSR